MSSDLFKHVKKGRELNEPFNLAPMKTGIMYLWQLFFADYGMIQVFFTLQMVVKSQNAIKCIIFCEKMWRVWAKQALFLESAPQNEFWISFSEYDAGRCNHACVQRPKW